MTGWQSRLTPKVGHAITPPPDLWAEACEILPRDAAPVISEASQIDKKVRVASTIGYLLGP